jgi:hypothetical protein
VREHRELPSMRASVQLAELDLHFTVHRRPFCAGE